jgi:hypothetical protein
MRIVVGAKMEPSLNDKPIQHVSELAGYSPPAHSGTVNRRLVLYAPPLGRHGFVEVPRK